MTLVGILITIAVATTIFMALYSAIEYSLRLSADSSARLAAMSLASERMEYFRSLSYNDVGTISGFPSGVIPQNRTITLNGIAFSERVLVDYIDDPADDELGVDSNGIITDYKKLKIEISWVTHGETKSISYVSNIVPVSVETNEGGGAINVAVTDADGSPLAGATVQVTNDTTGPTIDVTRVTGPAGVAAFIVPASSNYHASATMAGYSTDGTYVATGGNPNPSPGSFTVAEALITDQGFQIGALSDLEISTFSGITDASSTVAFADTAEIQASSSVTLNVGRLELKESLGVFEASGSARLQQIEPASLERWESAVIVGTAPLNTAYRVHFYTGTTTGYELVAETDLPGNAAGFTDRIVDLSALDVVAYPDLTVELDLTGDTTDTPHIDDLAVYYRESETARSNVDLTVRSKKTIGTGVYKYDAVHSSGVGAVVSLPDMEFDDEYMISNGDGLTLTRACANADLNFQQLDVLLDHQAGVDTALELVLENTPDDTLLVVAKTNDGVLLPGAVVVLSRSGYGATTTTDACGQGFFSNTDGVQVDYTVEVSRLGYDTYTNSSYEINGDTRLSVVLHEL